MRLLNEFTPQTPEIGVSELGRRIQLDKVIVHRLLKTMQEFGVVEQCPQTKRYRLGGHISKLATIRRTFVKPLHYAAGPLLSVREQIDETVHLSQLEGDQIIVTFVSECSHTLRVVVDVGEILPAYCTGPGLLFLAHAGADFRRATLSGDLKPLTPSTLTDPAAIEALLPRIRSEGIATVDETYSGQAKAISAPVFDAQGKIIAAATILGPSFRLNGVEDKRARELIAKTARSISERYGFSANTKIAFDT